MEALIAGALALVVLGGGALVYLQGNRMFQTTTEHASAREEALLILERMNKDLEMLMVSDEVDAMTGQYFMVQPYRLTGEVKPAGAGEAAEFSGLQFHVYHHTQTAQDSATGFPVPQLVGRLIDYRLEPIGGDPRKGHNLLRNGVKLNRQPLTAVFFRRGKPVIAKDNVGASPDAVLEVTVIPHGGLWGTMTPDALDRLVAGGHALTRTFHLAGYESQYTAMLSLAETKVRYGEAPDPLEQAVLDHAAKNGLTAVSKANPSAPPLEYRLPEGRVRLEEAAFDAATAGDREFASAPSAAGVQEQGKTEANAIQLSAGSQSTRVTF